MVFFIKRTKLDVNEEIKMLNIRKAKCDDIDIVLDLYKDLIDKIKNNKFTPEWEYGIYPREEYIIDLIKSNEVYVGEIDSEIVSSIVINHKPNPGYENIKWNTDLENENVYYIHLVAVNPSHKRKGIGKEMLNFSFNQAKENSVKSIRLSVVKNNLPAENLYKKFDFEHIDSIEVYDKYRGLKHFKVFEKVLN